ncbi:MAG: polyprenyl synthetase family protein [Arenimonas sp.]
MPTDAARLERALDALLPPADALPARLHAAMRYAALDGGKRLRARLVYATGRLFGLPEDTLDPAACAVELIHAYSLVHDDLPAMDDDALRRGKPTVHVAFDQATAILAGDALQTAAFEALALADWPDAAKLRVLAALLAASGSRGMCGGQQLDMDANGQGLDLDALRQVHALKTGALIKAAIRMPAELAGADAATLADLSAFADDLGLAFQIRDDILDVEASTEQLGKSAGKDAAQDKSTYPALLGLDGAKAWLAQLAERMPQQLARFGERAVELRELADFAVSRGH